MEMLASLFDFVNENQDVPNLGVADDLVFLIHGLIIALSVQNARLSYEIRISGIGGLKETSYDKDA